LARVKDLVAQAGRHSIVVELVLFCPLHADRIWQVSPMRAANNVDGFGKIGRTEAFALKEKALTEFQEAVARKLVAELKDCDNVYFEVCNEPYFGGVTRAWQDRIVDAEKGRSTSAWSPRPFPTALPRSPGHGRDRPHTAGGHDAGGIDLARAADHQAGSGRTASDEEPKGRHYAGWQEHTPTEFWKPYNEGEFRN